MRMKTYFYLIKEFSVAKFKIKDQRSILGFLWSFLNPLIMTSILYFLFKSRLGQDNNKDYFLYVLVGTVTWNFFVMATSAGLASIIHNAEMARNVAFPKEILVYSEVGVFIIQHFFELLAVFVFISLFGVGFSAHILLLPIIIAIEILLITGIALFLSFASVYVRDLDHIWNVLTRMGFFVVPIFYTASSISPAFKWAVAINPMSQIMTFLRKVLLYHDAVSAVNLILVFIFSLAVLTLGYASFKHYEYKIVEKV